MKTSAIDRIARGERERRLKFVRFDIISFLNRFAHVSWPFDSIVYLVDSTILGASPLAIAIWWGCFKEGEDQERNREYLLFGIFSMFLAIFLARILSSFLAFREKPLRNPVLHFVLPLPDGHSCRRSNWIRRSKPGAVAGYVLEFVKATVKLLGPTREGRVPDSLQANKRRHSTKHKSLSLGRAAESLA